VLAFGESIRLEGVVRVIWKTTRISNSPRGLSIRDAFRLLKVSTLTRMVNAIAAALVDKFVELPPGPASPLPKEKSSSKRNFLKGAGRG
jgi:hypothetical protein